ncbi:hypothetical protein H0W26_04210 [Candidatus Dependentiae bacterium]|nr:hypothetical protein [Candidatus Dependentiae bacterium]
MNIRFLACVAVFSVSPFMHGVDESIAAAIKSSNIESLKALLMPGAYVRLQDKKIYSSLAQQKTRETYMNLQSSGLIDIKYGFTALVKAGAALFFAKEFYDKCTIDAGIINPGNIDNGNVDNGQLIVVVEEANQEASGFSLSFAKKVMDNCIAKPKEALTTLGGTLKEYYPVLAASYFAYKSLEDVHAISYKDDRYNKYIHALAVESLIARVPVFEQ